MAMTWASVLSSLAVAVATGVLAFLTYRYVQLTRETILQQKSLLEPNVYVDFEAPDSRVRFTVGNAGQRPAVNVKFIVYEDVTALRFGDAQAGIQGIPVVSSGISYLVPGRKLKWIAGRTDDLGDAQGQLKLAIEFQNEDGADFRNDVVIDIGQYAAVLLESFQDTPAQTAAVLREVANKVASASRRNQAWMPQLSQKRCEHCGERIQRNAKKCPHCLEWCSGSDSESENELE